MRVYPGLKQVHLTALKLIFQAEIVNLHFLNLLPYLIILLQLSYLFLDNIQHIIDGIGK